MKNLLHRSHERRRNPIDRLQYHIAAKAIDFSCAVLEEYAHPTPPHEGMVYWAGIKEGHRINISCVIAPRTVSGPGRVVVTPESNARVVIALSKRGLIHIGQVHSHPSDWVDHSPGDDEYAAFKYNGLISIVVPSYCEAGMLPLNNCGVHRFSGSKFIWLADQYVGGHFKLVNSMNTEFLDLRNE